MTPLRLDRLPSPIGQLLVVWDTDQRLKAIDYEDYENRMRLLLDRQVRRWTLAEGRAPADLARAVEAYFDGDDAPLAAIPVALGGTAFQRSVWEALQGVPAGVSVTYGAIAERIGRPTASRAVGFANGSNPIAIRVPCHRVVGADGGLTGYGGGLWRKQWLLAHEATGAGPR